MDTSIAKGPRGKRPVGQVNKVSARRPAVISFQGCRAIGSALGLVFFFGVVAVFACVEFALGVVRWLFDLDQEDW